MMLQRFVVAAVLVAALAGLFEQNEANEYESALTKLDNWLVNHPDRPENNQWWEDLEFFAQMANSKESKKGKDPVFSDQKVKNLVNLFPRIYERSRFIRRELDCRRISLPIIKDLIAMIEKPNEAASSRNDGPLRRYLTSQLNRLKGCHNLLVSALPGSITIQE